VRVVTGQLQDSGDLRRCRQALSGHPLLALDCEGVSLGGKGETSLIQLSTPEECFLLDVQGKPWDDPVVELARELLEDETVCKIIHDCAADSDIARNDCTTHSDDLGMHIKLNNLGIKLRNVHDTTQVVCTLPPLAC